MADLKEVQSLVESILAKHDKAGVPFAFDRAKRRLGGTHWYGSDVLGWTPKLTLSRAYCEAAPIEHIEQTIKHEVAHVLTGTPRTGHGPEWKRQCRVTGYTGKRMAALPPTVLEAMYANH